MLDRCRALARALLRAPPADDRMDLGRCQRYLRGRVGSEQTSGDVDGSNESSCDVVLCTLRVGREKNTVLVTYRDAVAVAPSFPHDNDIHSQMSITTTVQR